ncbi:MAG: hypothetical protein ACI4TW_02145 [Prevotella sp.]
MKRFASILTVMLLSAVIILLGVGISFVHCCHTKATEMVQISDMRMHEKDNHDNCEQHSKSHDCTDISSSPCMKITVVKLEPTLSAKHQTPQFTVPCIPLSPFINIPTIHPLPILAKSATRHTDDSPHSPPRDYLRLIRILLI